MNTSGAKDGQTFPQRRDAAMLDRSTQSTQDLEQPPVQLGEAAIPAAVMQVGQRLAILWESLSPVQQQWWADEVDRLRRWELEQGVNEEAVQRLANRRKNQQAIAMLEAMRANISPA